MNKKVFAIIIVAFFSFFVFGMSEVKGLTCGYGGVKLHILEFTDTPALIVTVTGNEISIIHDQRADGALSGNTRVVQNDYLTPAMFANGCLPSINYSMTTNKIYESSSWNTASIYSFNPKFNSSSEKPSGGGSIDCSDIFREADGVTLNPFGEIVQDTIRFVQYLAPILVIVFTTIDYVKAMTSQDKEELQKATSRGIKRLLIAVALFFVPALIMYILGLTNIVADPLCGLMG